MKIKLTPKTVYSVEIDGVKIPGLFAEEDKWHGMACMSGELGKIIVSEGPTENLMSVFFGNILETNGLVVFASPSILDLLTAR